jgi:hypothetical protein
VTARASADDRSAGRAAVAAYWALSLLAVAPVLAGYSTLAGDTLVHANWQAVFAPMVWEGTLYPRWLPAMNQGFGSPAFFFYPPMLQWLGALFWPLFPAAAQAVTRLCLAVALASALGAIGCRRWALAIGLSPGAAGLAGAVFVLMPYRLFVDFYMRGALPELVGISAMPWLLYTATRLQAPRAAGWIGYACSVAAILYCHLPAALMGLLMSSGYVLVIALAGDRGVLARAALGTAIGFGLAAPCVVPALGLLRHLVDTAAMFGERNQPVHWLLFSTEPWVDPMMHAVTLALVAAALVAATLLAVSGWGERRRLNLGYLLVVVVATAFLTTQWSRPLWALQTPLSRIQFPFRLLSLQAVALSGLAGLALAGSARPWVGRLIRLGVPGLLLLDAALIGVQHWRGAGEPALALDLPRLADTSEYVLGRSDLAATRLAQDGVRLQAQDYRRLAYTVEAPAPMHVAVHQFAFTGWDCRVDGGAWQAAGQLPRPYGLATCPVPVGRHRVDLRLPATPFETAGWAIALGALAVILGQLALARRRSAGQRA